MSPPRASTATATPALEPRHHSLWLALLVAALAQPILTAPHLVALTGLRLDSLITRSMVIGGGLVLLLWAGLPALRAARAARATGGDHTTRATPVGRNLRSFGLALSVTLVCCAAFSAGMILGGAEALRPVLFRPDRLLTALGIGLAVSVVEEPVFRWLLLSRLSFGGSAALGSVLSSALYSYVHYLRPPRVQSPGPHGIDDSLAVYGDMAHNLLAPLHDPAPALGLFLLGLLLCAVVRRGGLAWTIGIHTGVVYYIKADSCVVYWMFDERHWLYGAEDFLYDGVLFWIVCTAFLVGVWRLAPPPRRDG